MNQRSIGVFVTGWPNGVATCDGCKLKVEGEFSSTIFTRGNSQVPSGDSNENVKTVEDHERVHESIAADFWNNFIIAGNSFDGKKLKSSECCEKYIIYLDAIQQVFAATEALANIGYDIQAYGGTPGYLERALESLASANLALSQSFPNCE